MGDTLGGFSDENSSGGADKWRSGPVATAPPLLALAADGAPLGIQFLIAEM